MSIFTNYEKFPLKKITLMDTLRVIESAAVKVIEEGSKKIIFEGGGHELIKSDDEELLSRVVNNIDCSYSVEYDIVITIELALIVNNMEFEKYKQMPTVKDVMIMCTGDEIIEVRYRDQKQLDPPELHIVIDGEHPGDMIRNNVVVGDTDLLDSVVKPDSLWTTTFINEEDNIQYTKILLWVDRKE